MAALLAKARNLPHSEDHKGGHPLPQFCSHFRGVKRPFPAASRFRNP
jgi:hypothetical protein